MKRIGYTLFFLVSLNIGMFGQYAQTNIFHDLSGEELLERLVKEYKSGKEFLNYGDSRDTLFSKVYNVNDSISCVYSGHRVYMNPGEDPTITVFLGGIPNGINTEHTFPRSKGADSGNPKSDMHHLYPTRVRVNERRGNLKFGESPDSETLQWFINDGSISMIPERDIDLYSELNTELFEPREDHKGNVARAMMYFYTMYRDEADAADPDFFESMREVLCDWHTLDPVDSLEWQRTHLIARYQEYPNPFVLDCSLASRLFCGNVDSVCQIAVSTIDFNETEPQISIGYDIERNEFWIVKEDDLISYRNFNLYSLDGRLMHSRHLNPNDYSGNQIRIKNLLNFSGAVLAQLILSKDAKSMEFTTKILILP